MEIQSKLFKAFIITCLFCNIAYGDIKNWGNKSKLYLSTGENHISNSYIDEGYSFKNIHISTKINMKDRLKFKYFYSCVSTHNNTSSECKFLTKTSTINFNNIFIGIGKDTVIWGRGMFFSPINYFHNVNFKKKFTSKSVPMEGIELVRFQAILENVSFESVYASEREEYGNRLSFFVYNISFSLSVFNQSKIKKDYVGIDFQIPLDNWVIYAEQNYVDDNQYLLGLSKDFYNTFDLFQLGVEFYDKKQNKNIAFYTMIEENDYKFTYSLSENIDKKKYEMFANIKYEFTPNLSLSVLSSNSFLEDTNTNSMFSYELMYKKRF